MTVYLIIYLLLIFLSLRIKKTSNFLEKDETTTINGIFILMVLFSHFYGYYGDLSKINAIPKTFVDGFGQLMVAPFLFFSGYGIYESIKNKKDYIKTFPKKRFLKLYINFAIALSLYLILNIVLNNNYSISNILLAFTGYESIGNSNWYIFATFVMYISVVIAFSKYLNKKTNNFCSIIIVLIISFIYIYIVSKYRGFWFVDTIICFPIGMFYSYFKEKINNIIDNNFSYLILLSFFIIAFFILYKQPYNIYLYNIESMFFVLMIALILRKIVIKNKILYFLGKNIFWIYILQRIPMIILSKKLDMILCFPLCLLITIVLMLIMKNISNMLFKKLNLN